MPITVNELVKEAGLDPKSLKKVKWGTPVSTQKEGVYIVSLSETPDANNSLAEIPISRNILKEWIDKVDGFKLGGKLTHDIKTIKHELSKFWLFDENILYIGKASNLHERIGAFYRHKTGKKSPHSGGHWIKILKNVNELYVYYIECDNCEYYEAKTLCIFFEQVSQKIKEQLKGTGIILPFANIEIRKEHKLGHMTKK